jgi:hypothetical protein
MFGCGEADTTAASGYECDLAVKLLHIVFDPLQDGGGIDGDDRAVDSVRAIFVEV